MVTDASGEMLSEVRYSAFGETRYQNGTSERKPEFSNWFKSKRRAERPSFWF